MAALIHRDDAAGVIAQRVIGSDPKTVQIIDGIVSAMWLEDSDAKPSLTGAIELFGWPIMREVAVVAMLHQANAELAGHAGMDPIALDRMALAVATAAVELGCDVFSALLANVGITGLAGIGGERYAFLRRSVMAAAELPNAELSQFGFSHASLGAAMLWEADLPDHVCRMVLDHCQPTSSIWLAEQIACDIGLGQGKGNLPEALLDRYQVSPQRLIRMKDAMAAAAGLPELHFAA